MEGNSLHIYLESSYKSTSSSKLGHLDKKWSANDVNKEQCTGDTRHQWSDNPVGAVGLIREGRSWIWEIHDPESHVEWDKHQDMVDDAEVELGAFE